MARPKNHTNYGERELHFAPPMEGRDVWELQIKLIGWGSGSDAGGIGAPFMPVRVTGKFDAATRDAVKRFQQAAVLPLTGIVDEATFLAIDKEAALYPVLVHPMRCPCVEPVAPAPGKKNDGPIPCRCKDHHSKGPCEGFGHAQYSGKYLLDGAKQFDGTSLSGEKLDVYDMQEYPGIDKALLWAVRALMRRANIDRIKVKAGYRCWHDNYHHTDERRWRHRKLTFHFGKSIEFYHDGTCAEYGQNPLAAPCATCIAIRTVALDLCGFQPRWQEPDRVSVAEVQRDVTPPANPFAVHVSTVRRRDREKDEFVKTFADSVKPLFSGKLKSYSLPIDLGEGRNWRTAPTAPYFFNTETAPGGWYPFGPNRTWHGGIHLYAAAATAVHAIADGEVVACRAGEADARFTFGSRNFVLLRHKTKKDKTWYSLYMHLDAEAPGLAAVTPWRKKLHLLTTDHVEMSVPCPLFFGPAPLNAEPGLGAGEWSQTAGNAEFDPRTAGGPLDPDAPEKSSLVELSLPANRYIYLKKEDEEMGKLVAADPGLQAAINGHDPLGLPNPIPVKAGERLGSIAQAPTDGVMNPHGAFLHLEVFSEDQLLSGKEYVLVTASDAAKALDRKAITTVLSEKKLIGPAPNDVLMEADVNLPGSGVNRAACRNTVLKSVSGWKLDWDVAVKAPESLKFMTDNDQDDAGRRMNRYRWWDRVQAAAGLPANGLVFHHHPITLLMEFAAEE